MDALVQVAGQITSKPTKNGGVKFDVPLSNGMKPSTFDAVLATKVSQFGGQAFTARIEQNGKFWNLVDAFGPGEQFLPEQPAAGTPISMGTTASGATTTTETATPIVPAGSIDTFPPEVTIRNTKRDAITVAYGFVAAHMQSAGLEFEEAVKRADSLALKLYGDLRSHEPGVVPAEKPAATPAAVAADPAAVAAFVAQEAGAPIVQVGVPAPGATTALPWTTN